MKKIKLSQNLYAIVDDEDFDKLNLYKWSATKQHKTYYAIRAFKKTDGVRTTIRMHRSIMSAPETMQVDHLNSNGLDNRKSNLRLCNNAENNRNRGKYITNTSGYKGVSWNKQHNKWRSQIFVDYKTVFLGYFQELKDAVQAYDEGAKKYHKNYAKLNLKVLK